MVVIIQKSVQQITANRPRDSACVNYLAKGMTNGISRDDNKSVEDISETPGMCSADKFHLSLMQHVTDEYREAGGLSS